jgi:hypothetical protein
MAAAECEGERVLVVVRLVGLGPNLTLHGTFDGVAVATLQSALPPLLEPTLGSGLGAFPLPSFLGLALRSVEVSRTGGFLTLYANLAPAP